MIAVKICRLMVSAAWWLITLLGFINFDNLLVYGM
jgi:hypothetical protein